MKMKMTMVAGAIALAVAGQANAQVVDTNAANGSDLFLSVFDVTTGTSFIQDLGVSASNFWTFDATGVQAVSVATPSFTLPTTVNPSLTTLLGAAAATDQVLWNVTAADTANQVVLSTALTSLTPAALTAAANVIGDAGTLQAIAQAQLLYFGVNLALGSTSTATSLYSTVKTGAGNANTGFGSNFGNNLKFTNATTLGSSMNFTFLSATGTGTPLFSQYAIGGSAAQFTLSSTGALTFGPAAVAAVPEPGEWLLMLSGLALLGFIATRRKGQGNTMAFA